MEEKRAQQGTGRSGKGSKENKGLVDDAVAIASVFPLEALSADPRFAFAASMASIVSGKRASDLQKRSAAATETPEPTLEAGDRKKEKGKASGASRSKSGRGNDVPPLDVGAVASRLDAYLASLQLEPTDIPVNLLESHLDTVADSPANETPRGTASLSHPSLVPLFYPTAEEVRRSAEAHSLATSRAEAQREKEERERAREDISVADAGNAPSRSARSSSSRPKSPGKSARSAAGSARSGTGLQREEETVRPAIDPPLSMSTPCVSSRLVCFASSSVLLSRLALRAALGTGVSSSHAGDCDATSKQCQIADVPAIVERVLAEREKARERERKEAAERGGKSTGSGSAPSSSRGKRGGANANANANADIADGIRDLSLGDGGDGSSIVSGSMDHDAVAECVLAAGAVAEWATEAIEEARSLNCPDPDDALCHVATVALFHAARLGCETRSAEPQPIALVGFPRNRAQARFLLDAGLPPRKLVLTECDDARMSAAAHFPEDFGGPENVEALIRGTIPAHEATKLESRTLLPDEVDARVARAAAERAACACVTQHACEWMSFDPSGTDRPWFDARVHRFASPSAILSCSPLLPPVVPPPSESLLAEEASTRSNPYPRVDHPFDESPGDASHPNSARDGKKGAKGKEKGGKTGKEKGGKTSQNDGSDGLRAGEFGTGIHAIAAVGAAGFVTGYRGVRWAPRPAVADPMSMACLAETVPLNACLAAVVMSGWKVDDVSVQVVRKNGKVKTEVSSPIAWLFEGVSQSRAVTSVSLDGVSVTKAAAKGIARVCLPRRVPTAPEPSALESGKRGKDAGKRGKDANAAGNSDIPTPVAPPIQSLSIRGCGIGGEEGRDLDSLSIILGLSSGDEPDDADSDGDDTANGEGPRDGDGGIPSDENTPTALCGGILSLDLSGNPLGAAGATLIAACLVRARPEGVTVTPITGDGDEGDAATSTRTHSTKGNSNSNTGGKTATAKKGGKKMERGDTILRLSGGSSSPTRSGRSGDTSSSSSGAQTLAATLKHLSLSGCDIGDGGARIIAQALWRVPLTRDQDENYRARYEAAVLADRAHRRKLREEEKERAGLAASGKGSKSGGSQKGKKGAVENEGPFDAFAGLEPIETELGSLFPVPGERLFTAGNRTLAALNVDSCGIGYEGATWIARCLSRNPSLVRISAGGNDIPTEIESALVTVIRDRDALISRAVDDARSRIAAAAAAAESAGDGDGGKRKKSDTGGFKRGANSNGNGNNNNPDGGASDPLDDPFDTGNATQLVSLLGGGPRGKGFAAVEQPQRPPSPPPTPPPLEIVEETRGKAGAKGSAKGSRSNSASARRSASKMSARK